MSTQLTFDTILYSNTSLELCYGDSILFGSNYYGSSGVYYDTLQAAAGCDSVSELVLNIRSLNYSVADSMQRCVGDSALIAGSYQSTSGLYLDTLQSVAGCDSIVTLDLTINNSYYVSDTVQRCTGDSAFLAGAYQTVNGTYIDTLQSVAGCDSIVISELIIDTLIYSSINLEICNGDSILFGGNYYVSSGTYYDTTQAQAGCDSLIQLSFCLLYTSPSPRD